MQNGRELSNHLRDAVRELRRTADATEEMLAMARNEQQSVVFEGGPPICPNCGAANPVVTTAMDSGSGPLDQFVMIGEAHCCNRTIYGVPQSWEMFIDRDAVRHFVGGREHDKAV
jgi:hypothetical protein